MTDRELLELAAKVAGFHDAVWAAKQACVETSMLPGFRCFWNPLTDDGDALRLAVKLSIRIYPYTGLGDDVSIAVASGCDRIQQEQNGDPYAATRRAIVRAAAEIGKEMK